MNGLKNVRNRRDDALARVGWDRLEVMLADYYRMQGWNVDHVGTGARRSKFDGGIDLKLRRGSEYVLVQSKHWNAKQVTHNAVHELLGIKINENATGAIVVTSGEFTNAAKEAAARQGHVQLIDGDSLRAMLGPAPEAGADEVMPHAPRRPASLGRGDSRPASGKSRGRTPSIESLLRIVFAFIALIVLVQCLPRYVQNAVKPKAVQPASVVKQQAAPSRVSIAAPASPYIPPPAPPPMTEAERERELKEWQRKNAESMKILEETTPEL